MSQRGLARQVQPPAPLRLLPPRWNPTYFLHQFARAQRRQGGFGEQILLDPLQQVVGDEDQPQKAVNRVELPAAQVAQSVDMAPRFEKRLDALPLTVHPPQYGRV